MELTPIKVRGKRKAAVQSDVENGRKAQKRGRGRPLSLPSSQSSSQVSSPTKLQRKPQKQTKKRSLKNLKSQRRMSPLERLPVELLEKVYLYALNLSLPVSSPIIAGKLSSEMIFVKTATAIFEPTWQEWLRYTEDAEDSTFPMNQHLVELQSAILRCRWFSLKILFKAKENWILSIAPRQLPHLNWFVRPRPENKNSSIWPDYSEDEGNYLTVEEHFDKEFERFSVLTSQENPRRAIEVSNWSRLCSDVDDHAEIPERLLDGQISGTDDQRKFLFWIVKSGARIQWETSTSGEVALAGLRTAITIGDIQSIHLLGWAGVSRFIDTSMVKWALTSAPKDKLRKTMNHLLLQARQYKIMSLLRADATTISSIIQIDWSEIFGELAIMGKNGSREIQQRAHSLRESSCFAPF